MINDIITAISRKLNTLFPAAEIYVDDVEQGLEPPCFFIASLQTIQTQIVGNRYHRLYPFDIHYWPPNDRDNTDMLDKAETLLTGLETVTTADELPIRGSEIHYEVIDGVLHFFINYGLIVVKDITPETNMETLAIDEGTI